MKNKNLKIQPQCAFLYDSGKRCKKRSGLKIKLHLEQELYKYPSWVGVNLCIEHLKHYQD